MNFNKVDLNLFVVFNAIYTEANLTRAAEVLYISQPAVSNALGRLRAVFNDPLFVRRGKSMTPTPVAHNNIARVREALQLLRTSVQEADIFDPESSDKRFCLSMGDLAETILLPRLCQEVHQKSPNIKVESFQLKRDEIPKELLSGKLDFAIDAPVHTDPDLLHEPLIVDRYVCAVRKDHPKIQGSLTMEQYLSLSHIGLSTRRRGLAHVDLALNKLGRPRRIVLETQHYLVAPKVVENTDYALTVAHCLAQQYDLQILELPFEVAKPEYHLYWHKTADRDQTNHWMRQQILGLTLDDQKNTEPADDGVRGDSRRNS